MYAFDNTCFISEVLDCFTNALSSCWNPAGSKERNRRPRAAPPLKDWFLIITYYLISQSDSRDPQNPGAHQWFGLRVRDERREGEGPAAARRGNQNFLPYSQPEGEFASRCLCVACVPRAVQVSGSIVIPPPASSAPRTSRDAAILLRLVSRPVRVGRRCCRLNRLRDSLPRPLRSLWHPVRSWESVPTIEKISWDQFAR